MASDRSDGWASPDVFAVPRHLAPIAVRHWKDIIQRSLIFDLGLQMEDVMEWLDNGEATLWVIAGKAFAITTIATSNGHKYLQLEVVAGDIGDNDGKLIDTLVEFGRFNGCETLIATGRPGWKKRAARLGFEHVTSTFERTI